VLSRRSVGSLQLHWRHTLAGAGADSVAVSGGTIYAGDDSRYLYALDGASGNEKWRFPISGGVGTPAVWNGVVYAPGNDALYAVDASTGKERWHFSVFGPTAPTPADGVVYVGTYLGGIYALDASTGKQKWFFPAGPVASSPAVADGLVVAGSDDDNVYAVDAVTGAMRWTFDSGGGVGSSPSLVGGVVYVGAANGSL
jgi:outer membrane protein assembly factor BamB